MKNIELLNHICDRFEKELEDQFRKIDKVPTPSSSDIEITDMLLHSLKTIAVLKSMEEHEYSGDDYEYSGSRYTERYSNRYPYMRNYSGKRDSMGRYSRDDEKNDMMSRLEDMMHNVRSEDQAIAIKDAMDAVSRIR